MTEAALFQRPAAFLLRLSRLEDLLSDQLQAALGAAGHDLKTQTTGVLNLLHHGGPAPITALSEAMGVSHQLVSQRLTPLLKAGLVELKPDPEDGRRKQVSLTRAGALQAEALQAFLDQLDQAYLDLFEELGVDLDALVSRAQAALTRRALSQRMAETV
ncbi:MarR family winged helix-turn-helix transcriptional regulator [Oceanicaulis sp. LC35]|uniref:MarR family winged helix-turn-helix transcriptional regulator n=1 Tax=Oceanicaulis sp. LC35 TaxID=3349635 RepID=UPI003F879285